MGKYLATRLCSNLPGQVVCETMVNEPKPGDPSYESYKAEWDAIFQSLKRRAQKVTKAFNELEGYSCNPSGALYAFPQIKFPPAWIAMCKDKGVAADTQYCLELLDATGICVIPGSGFGQAEGTFHFRTTFLPKESSLDGILERLGKFHAEFMSKYKSTFCPQKRKTADTEQADQKMVGA